MTERIADLAWWLVMAIRQEHEPHDPPTAIAPIVVAAGSRRYVLSIAHEEL
jgi:hypothetical protein